MFGLLLVSGAVLGGCTNDPAAIDDELVLDRALQPLNFEVAVLSTGDAVRAEWDVREKVSYELKIYLDEAMTQEVYTQSEILPADVPVTVQLEAEKEYYATVQAFSDDERVAPSLLAVNGPIKTYALMTGLDPVLTDRTATSISLSWTKDQYVSHVLVSSLTDPTVEPMQFDLTAEQVEAAAATVEGLNPSTLYLVELCYNSAMRGEFDVWTRPDMEAFNEISTVEQLMQAFVEGGKYKLAYSETPYVVPEYADPAVPNPASALAKDLTIVGETTLEGKKPVIQGLGIGLATGVTMIHLEDLSLDPVGKASCLMEVKSAVQMTSVTQKNLDLTGYLKLYYDNVAESSVSEFLFDGIYAQKMANSGGDFIDFRQANNHGTMTIQNSTFFDGARSFLRLDKGSFIRISVTNNTFASFAVAEDGNNKGTLYVRAAITDGFIYTNNLFLNETGSKARFFGNGSTVVKPTEVAKNYFFNCAEDFFTGTLASGAVTKADALAGGGKELTADPCVNSARGKFYLVNDEISAARVGDPRWWKAVEPVIPEQAELEAISQATVWDFTNPDIFEPQEMTENHIFGNLKFFVNNPDAPMSITEAGTVAFSAASRVAYTGEPTNNAMAFKVSVPGTVLLTAADGGYNKHMEILVNGERYAFPADGNQAKFGFADISEETIIYILSCSPVELTALEWSLEVISGGEPVELAAPVFAAEIPAFDQGTAQDVVLSWEAVEHAVAYDVTFNGKTSTVETPVFTIPAADAAKLTAGVYEISVVAKPAEGSLNYLNSNPAVTSFKVKGVLTTVKDVYTWDIADAALFPAGDVLETEVIGNLQFIASDSKKMTIEHSVGDGGSKTDRIKFNGKSTVGDGFVPSERGLALRVAGAGKLTVKAISSSSSDATREVAVSANGKEYLREACPTSSDGDAKVVDLSDLSGETMVYIYCYNTVNIYALSWEPSVIPATKDYTMTFTTEGGQLTPNVSGLKTSWGENTWTATDTTGQSTLTFTGNVYYSSDASKQIIWYFNKNNATAEKGGTYVTCNEFGKIRKITLTMDPLRNKKYAPKYLTMQYDAADATKVLVTEEDPETSTTTFTYDFEKAGIETGYFKLVHNDAGQNVELGVVEIEYTK